MHLIGSIYRLRRNGYSGPFFIGLTMFVIGLQLLLPYDSFSTAPSYAVMRAWAAEGTWAVFFIFCSTFMTVASIKRKPGLVSVGALVAAFAWLVTWASVVIGNPGGILMPITLVMTVRCMSIFREFAERRDDPHLTGPDTQ